jgi:hypothetical protein
VTAGEATHGDASAVPVERTTNLTVPGPTLTRVDVALAATVVIVVGAVHPSSTRRSIAMSKAVSANERSVHRTTKPPGSPAGAATTAWGASGTVATAAAGAVWCTVNVYRPTTP